jgi:glycosyltransferase involved in cell wall biosynthesis
MFEMADILVQPSHHEGMPMSMLEALARGLPVVATAVGAVADVMTDGREGRMVPPHSPDRLAEAIRKTASDAEAYAAMSKAARRLAEARFSLDRFQDDLIRLYDERLLKVDRHFARTANRPFANLMVQTSR